MIETAITFSQTGNYTFTASAFAGGQSCYSYGLVCAIRIRDRRVFSLAAFGDQIIGDACTPRWITLQTEGSDERLVLYWEGVKTSDLWMRCLGEVVEGHADVGGLLGRMKERLGRGEGFAEWFDLFIGGES